ncbi:UNVERIFIED_CONTAM: hypothetical protein FKN15_036669 [Acipenser sinensis]
MKAFGRALVVKGTMYVSALTTPARLSPVDLHYSLPTQVPTFEITSPNSRHAASLPPAAPVTYRVEEEQPLLRRYQVPLQDVQRHDLYRQRRSYLNDSTGSLPSSPLRTVEDDEYETTQEYLSSLEQPKKTASNSKRWKKSKLNGHISHRGEAVRDDSSRSCMSESDSEEEHIGESTPFLSMQNMNMVPTFEITSPNSRHAASLPPAAPVTYRVEEEQPLLRRYQVPLQDVQRHDPYRQRRSYLNDSTGSLPSSPLRMVEDDEYETTQEYLSSLEQPKKTASNSKRWKKSKLNGHISHRGEAVRDDSSRSCMSESDSEEEHVGESTPFLSMQNMNMVENIEPSTVYRLAESRTYYSSNRHNARGNVQTRVTHTRAKQDSAPL